MAYRWHPKYSETNPDDPRAWGTCDRCGRIWNLHRLQWQFAYQGSSQLQNTRFLVCETCYDVANPQLSPVILSPDPPPLFNTRAENYTLDETNWLTTQDDDIIDTESGDQMTPTLPNPSDNANTASLVTALSYPSGTLSNLYLDLFNGNPTSNGTSVLSLITGSSTRTNIASDLTINGENVAVNSDVIEVASSSAAQTNISYVAIYSASSGGTLLASAPVAVLGQLIGVGTRVAFQALDLSIDLS